MMNFFKKDPPLNYIFLPYKVTGIKTPSQENITYLKMDVGYLHESSSEIDPNEHAENKSTT